MLATGALSAGQSYLLGSVKMKKRVFFLCTGNSARSQMAEGILRSKASDRAEVFSAGTKPKGVNPLSIQVMQEVGIDISKQESKDLSLFAREKFDWVITVCDRAKEACHAFPGAQTIHCTLPDPEDLLSFRGVRDDLMVRMEHFLREHFLSDPKHS